MNHRFVSQLILWKFKPMPYRLDFRLDLNLKLKYAFL
jgi:hypothetical protein